MKKLVAVACRAAFVCSALIGVANAGEPQRQPASPPSALKLVAQPWWSNSVIYEIYPRSFQDSDGDGVGDLNGIVQRLDYLKGLGVTAIWLTPIYPSPQADFGYDISDFTAIDPLYGTMADFDRLMTEAKKRDMRVIMDLVLNHTSDEHPWFKASASSKDNPKRDWYVWNSGRPGADRKNVPPNNWVNRIEQSPWQWDPLTGQFYYHYYDVKQPDLNWRNPEVEKAMFEAAGFWLKKGVAGFRLDAINTLFEDQELRDAPPGVGTNEYGEPSLSMVRQRNQPEVHQVLQNLRSYTDGFADHRMLIGEIYTYSTDELATWYGTPERPEIQLPMNTNIGFLNKLDAAAFRKLMSESEKSFAEKTPVYVFDNHDRPRSWDRYGDGQNNDAIARIVATILLATRGTALIYQGQEIGMVTTTPTRKEDVRDPRGIAGWPREKGRDGERTPMQWSGAKGAGFTSGSRAWLPIPAIASTNNVAAQQGNAHSLLTWYQTLIDLRTTNPAMQNGRMKMLDRDGQQVLAWTRTDPSDPTRIVVVACNMSKTPVNFSLIESEFSGRAITPLIRSVEEVAEKSMTSVHLAPFETFIGQLK